MKEPIILSGGPIYSQGIYDVFVGSLDVDKLPMYVVRNRDTKVVEFTHEVTQFYRDWLNHFAKPALEEPQLNLSLVTKN